MDRFSDFVSILVLVCCVSTVIIDKNPIVKLDKLGVLQGNTMMTRLGLEHYAFRRIPYAQPPVGPLRFKPPEVVLPWSGVLNATEDGPICPQPSSNASQPMSEDCLILNIYTHWLPTTDEREDCSFSSKAKAVIFYIHGGGFVQGSSASDTGSGPQLMMDRDIVLVTINYRLGALGFLSTGTREYPGNYGMMDQVLALKWVRDHIKYFGGNPDSVTTLGYSAGSISITLLMISPMSIGLFHKAMAQSGSGVGQFDLPCNQYDLAKQQAEVLNCSTVSISDMMNCLRVVDANALGQSYTKLVVFVCPLLLYLPVIDGKFLIEQPEKSYQNGKCMRIPVVTGVTEYEWLPRAIIFLRIPEAVQRLNSNFRSMAPQCAWYEEGTELSFRASDTFRSTFPYPIANNNMSVMALEKLLSYGIIKFPQRRFVRLTCKYTKVYYYQSVFVNDFNILGKAYHGSDLYCSFVHAAGVPRKGQKDSYTLCIERFTRLFSRFARTGKPDQPQDEYWKCPKWKPTTVEKFEYMEFGDNLVMKENYDKEIYERWEKLFPVT